MEKILEDSNLIIEKNEKLIANILHDIKSPLYSIKIALQNKLDCELNSDIYETTLGMLEYIENFLVNYSFKEGKFNNKIASCDIKKLINEKIESYKYIFIEKNIHIDFCSKDESYIIETIPIFLSSILNNIISNIAFHALENQNAQIELYRKNNEIYAEFQNLYKNTQDNFSLGLDFCRNLAIYTKTNLKFSKTKDKVIVSLKIPQLNIA